VTVRSLPSFRPLSLAVAAAVLALPPFGPAAAAPSVHTIVIDKMKFGPAPARLHVGDTIIWINRDMFRHSATARDKSFNIELAPQTSGKVVLRRAGTIAFYCIYHPGMTGSLSVSN
jgi:plastocyanin